MRTIFKRLNATAAVMLLTVAGAQSAQAVPDDGYTAPPGVAITAEIASYLATLPVDQRQEFVDSQLPATTTMEVGAQLPANAVAAASLAAAKSTGSAITPLAVGCWQQRWNWSGQAAAGNTLYTFYHVGHWCASGTTVRSAAILDAGGETRTPGWRYEGIVARSSGVVANQGRSYTQHKFVLGVGGWDIQTSLRCFRVKGTAAGTSTSDGTCGIY